MTASSLEYAKALLGVEPVHSDTFKTFVYVNSDIVLIYVFAWIDVNLFVLVLRDETFYLLLHAFFA